MEKEYLRTAAFAALAGVNKKTLHYYDEIGLFRPAYVNEKGYRFYSLFQLDQLALIVTLKDLGVPLREIRDYLGGCDPARMDEILARQSAELARRIAQLTDRQALLEAVRRQNRAFLDWGGKGPQRLAYPAERAAVLMDGRALKRSRLGIVNYLTDGPGTGLCAEGEERFLYQRRADGPLLLPGGDYLCLFETASGSVWDWLVARRRTLEEYAAARNWRLDARAWAEMSELSPGDAEPGSAGPRMIRRRILDESESNSS